MSILVWIVFGVIAPVAITVGAGRLLGARRGWVALVFSGLVGWSAAVVLGGVLTGWYWGSFEMPTVVFVLGTLFTMLVAVGLDLLAPVGSLARGEAAGLVQVTNPLTALRNKVEPLRRYREVVAIARRNGVLSRPSERQPLPIGVRVTLEEAGGIFVKLGQVASTRTDLLPPAWCTELTKLRSSAEPQPESAMRPHLEAELGVPPDELFAEFRWDPLASASIAQVYRARLHDGTDVVVKVQRPNLDELIARDSAAVMQLARLIERRTVLGLTMQPVGLAREFLDGVRDELDFTVEAANAIALGTALEQVDGIRVPRVWPELSGRQVLVEEYVDGPSIGDEQALTSMGLDRTALAGRVIEAFMHQIFAIGVFHADPHPGNILVEADGTIVLIDLGAIGRLGPTQAMAVLEMMSAAAAGKATQMRLAMGQFVIFDRDVDLRVLDAQLEVLLARHMRTGGGITTRAFEDLTQLVGEFGLRLPHWFGTLSRTLVTLEGTLTSIDPGFSLVDSARAHAEQHGLLSTADVDLRKLMEQEAMLQLPRLRRVPQQIDELLGQAIAGRLSARVSIFSDRRDERVITRLVDRLVLAIIAASTGLGSVLLVGSEGGPVFQGDVTINEVIGYVGLAASSVLALRVVAGVVRDGQV
jgi:ubiquinone biosynthesis protein